MPTKKTPAKKGGKSQSKKTLERIQAKRGLVNEDEILGYKVWWDLERIDGPRKDFRAMLEHMGYGDFIVPDPKPVQRMTAAGKKVAAGLGVTFKKAGIVDGYTTFRPVKFAGKEDDKEKKSQHKLSIDTKVLAPISVAEDGSVSLGDKTCPVAATLVDEYKRLEHNIWIGDVLDTLINIFEGFNTVRIKRRGGLYFIPVTVGDDIKKKLDDLATFIQSIGECDLYIDPVLKGGAAARSATRSATRSLDGQYGEVLSAADEFIETLESGEFVYGRSLNARIKAVTQLKKRAGLYSEILKDRGKALTKASDILSKAMKEIIDASVEVKALKKISNSKETTKLANEKLRAIADKARDELKKARGQHEPVVTGEEV